MRTIFPPNPSLIPKQAKCVFKGVIYSVYQWQQEMFDNTNATFEMLKRPDTVLVIPIIDDKILIAQELQPNYPIRLTRLLGGRHDHADETELQAAQRELLEETGLTFSDWRILNVTQPNRKIDQFVYTFVAKSKLSEEDKNLDNGEQITTKLVSLKELKTIATSPDSYLINSLELLGAANTEDLYELGKPISA